MIQYMPLWQAIAGLALAFTGGACAAGSIIWRLAERAWSVPDTGEHAPAAPRWQPASPPPAVYADITGPLPITHEDDWEPEQDWDAGTLGSLWRDDGEWGRAEPVDEPGPADTALMRADSRTLATLDALQEIDPETAVFYQKNFLNLAGAR